MKKVSLRTLLFVQAMVAFCIPVYYHLMVVYRLHSNAPVWIAIVLLAFVGWLKRNADIVDEYAKKTMQMADAACFRAAFVLMGILILPFLLLDGISYEVPGYLLTGGIFILALVRAIIFYWIDKNGMESGC